MPFIDNFDRSKGPKVTIGGKKGMSRAITYEGHRPLDKVVKYL
jgi:hypothetical protein